MSNKKVSVILSSFNAKERLRFALASYEFQSYPKDLFEVIVIDDGSSDGTFEMMKKFKYSFSLIYRFYSQNAGRAAARNRGLQLAKGEIVIFSDSDMIVEKDFILKHVQHHERDHQIFVGGNFWNRVYTHIYPARNILIGLKRLKKIRQYVFKESWRIKQLKRKKYIPLFTIEDLQNNNFLRTMERQPWASFYERIVNTYGSELKEFHFPWLYFVLMNVSVRRKHLENVGFFDEGFKGWGGEDEEIGYRLFQSGVRGMIDPEIKNYHQEHPRKLIKQDEEQEKNKLYLVQKHLSTTTILNYYFTDVDILTRNKFLNNLDSLKDNGIVSKTFHNNFGQLLHSIFKVHYENKTVPYPFSEKTYEQFERDLKTIKGNDEFKVLAQFIENKLLSFKWGDN